MVEVFFDEEKHRYLLKDGTRLPSVTEILKEFVYVHREQGSFYVDTLTGNTIDAEVMRRAGDYGTAVHKATELVFIHGKDGVQFPEEIRPSMDALYEWKDDFKPEIVMLEGRMASTKHGFAGTFDILCVIGGRLSLVDIKTGAGRTVGPQTAAYEALYRENTGERRPIDRYRLFLPKKEGRYRFDPLKNPKDWQFFQYSLFRRTFLAEL